MTDVTTASGTDLRSLAAEINREHHAAEQAVNEALGHARNAGELLTEAKASLRHGQWGEWLEGSFGGSPRTARRYMRIADRWDEIKAKRTRVADLAIRDADRLLSEPRDDQPGTETRSSPDAPEKDTGDGWSVRDLLEGEDPENGSPTEENPGPTEPDDTTGNGLLDLLAGFHNRPCPEGLTDEDIAALDVPAWKARMWAERANLILRVCRVHGWTPDE